MTATPQDIIQNEPEVDEEEPGFENVPPGDLIIGANIRGRSFDKKFLASIKGRGIKTAVTGYRDEDGRIVVLWGQQRVLAAVEAGRRKVPVMIVAQPDEVDRIADQVEENDKRTALTTGERVAAFEQMAAFGLPAAEIAKRTHRDKKEVAAALAVAASPLAKGAVGRYAFLDLTQAEVVAEFADDKEAVKKLIVTAKDGGPFAHVAQQLRDARADAAKRTAIEAGLTEAGLRVLTDEERQDGAKVCALGHLLDTDNQALTEESHSGCPGHAAYVAKGWHYIEVPADEDQADEDQDETGDGGEGAEGAEGVRTKEVYDWMPRYVCADWQQHGHRDRYASSTPGKKAADDKTDEQREAERAKRRDVIQSNKDWTSATTVRRDWLRTFLTRKTAPKGAAGFIATSLAGPWLGLADGYGLAGELLGLGDGMSSKAFIAAYTQAVSRASEARAQVLSLALVLSAYEYQLRHKDSWRSDREEFPQYLRFLESCNYPLADIERRACGEQLQAAAEPDGEDSADPADDE